jgi:acyl-CoA thioesterase-1
MRRPVAVMLALALLACSSPRDTPTSTGRTPVPTRGPERYVAIGASDTVGVGARDPATGSWPARVAAKLVTGSTYANYGVSGSLAAQALRDQTPQAIARDPTMISIWLAVNDLNAGVDPAQYGATLDAMLDLLVSRTTATIFIGNVPDLRAVPIYARLDPQFVAQRVSAFNAAVARSVGRHPARVVPVDLFTGSAELVSSATVSADGFHPSDRGYELIADRFLTAMRQAGMRVRT